MPLPVIAAGAVALMEFCVWVAGRFAIKRVWTVVAASASTGVMFVVKGEAWAALKIFFEEEWEGIQKRFRRVVFEIVKDDTGLELDPDDPLGPGSLSRAISGKVGIPIRDITNKESTVEDLEQYAIGRINEKSGFTITSLRDKEKIVKDMQRIAGQVFMQKTGIPVTNFDSPEAIKADVLAWAEAKVAEKIADNIAQAAVIKNEFGVSVVDQVKAIAGKDLSGKNLIEGAKNALLSAAVRVNDRARIAAAPDRRTLQNRESQRRFRERHGNRMKYVSLAEQPGFIGPKKPPEPPVVLKKVERPIRRNALGIPIRGGA